LNFGFLAPKRFMDIDKAQDNFVTFFALLFLPLTVILRFFRGDLPKIK